MSIEPSILAALEAARDGRWVDVTHAAIGALLAGAHPSEVYDVAHELRPDAGAVGRRWFDQSERHKATRRAIGAALDQLRTDRPDLAKRWQERTRKLRRERERAEARTRKQRAAAGRAVAGAAAQAWAEGAPRHSGGFSATERRNRGGWAAGWDRDESCPVYVHKRSPPGRNGWRDVGPWTGERWRELHGVRWEVYEKLRRAGYIARHEWHRELTGTRKRGVHEVEEWTYTSGPAIDCEAVDPWRMARRVATCCAAWPVSLRHDQHHGLTVAALPQGCGAVTLCPVCGAKRSTARAAAARTVISAAVEEGFTTEIALVTLTHRDRPGESLVDALDRLRAAWRKLSGGRQGMALRERCPGILYGVEATRGGDGRGQWWHTHMHLVVLVGPEWSAASVRAWLGAAWRKATREASLERTSDDEKTGWKALRGGWEPFAGGCTMGDVMTIEEPDLEQGVRALRRWVTDSPITVPGARKAKRDDLVAGIVAGVEDFNLARWESVMDWSGEWWRDIPSHDLSAVYQACKYPTPIVGKKKKGGGREGELSPADLAEWVAAAFGRRWNDGLGLLRHVEAMAEQVEAVTPPGDGDEEAPPVGLPLGVNIASMAPGEVPDIRDILPGYGLPEGTSEPAGTGDRTWLVPSTVPLPVRSAMTALGATFQRVQREAIDEDGNPYVVVYLRVSGLESWAADELRRRREAERGDDAEDVRVRVQGARDGPPDLRNPGMPTAGVPPAPAAEGPPGCPGG